MEFNELEATVIEKTAMQVIELDSSELQDLRLALVGGGNAVVLFI
jgi:hypothetical protein